MGAMQPVLTRSHRDIVMLRHRATLRDPFYIRKHLILSVSFRTLPNLLKCSRVIVRRISLINGHLFLTNHLKPKLFP